MLNHAVRSIINEGGIPLHDENDYLYVQDNIRIYESKGLL